MPGRILIASTVKTTVVPAAGATTYMLVADSLACSDSSLIVLTANALPPVNPGASQTIFASQTAQLGGSPTSSAAGATYLWSPAQFLSDSASGNPMASPNLTTWYKVVVKDAAGCVNSDSVLLTVVPQIVLNSGFTPNGDGKNDTWVIDGIQKFPKCLVEVYNRWGQLLFSSVGYPTPWDGKYNGENLPVGTYYYAINLNDPLFPAAYTGPLTIMR